MHDLLTFLFSIMQILKSTHKKDDTMKRKTCQAGWVQGVGATLCSADSIYNPLGLLVLVADSGYLIDPQLNYLRNVTVTKDKAISKCLKTDCDGLQRTCSHQYVHTYTYRHTHFKYKDKYFFLNQRLIQIIFCIPV